MDILDRLLAHDTWTTRQLLEACQSIDDLSFDQGFDIDHNSLRMTFEHIIGNMETWTDLLYERPVLKRTGITIRASNGPKCWPDWKPNPENCGRLVKWKEPAANRMS